MTQEETLILDILLWLAKAGETKTAPPSLQHKEQAVRTFISVHYPYATAEELQALKRLTTTGEVELDEVGNRCAYIVLPPAEPNGGFIPMINVEYDTSSGTAEMRIRTGLFMFNQPLHSKPSSIGFRCEPPEGDGGGHHDYFHAQFIHRFVRHRDEPQLTWPTYIPTSQPAFPIYAHGPLTLLFSTMMAIYGKKFLRGEFLSDFSSNNFLMARLREWPPISC